ncbi:hypothetical protein BFZC1_02347 [Lysinibacillus fusiformis ZC1]|nr:hypothetical protein BFZC1_02347 [Lysinibacillus fusiformis ZC1]
MLLFSVKRGGTVWELSTKFVENARLEAKIILTVSNYQHNFMGNKV